RGNCSSDAHERIRSSDGFTSIPPFAEKRQRCLRSHERMPCGRGSLSTACPAACNLIYNCTEFSKCTPRLDPLRKTQIQPVHTHVGIECAREYLSSRRKAPVCDCPARNKVDLTLESSI